MNNYEDWAQLVAKKLEHESNLLAAIDKDEFDDAGASEAFVRAVLEPFLPENYGIGSGRIVDAFGNHSNELEIIVYNRDFPRIGMRGTHSAFLYESVLAAFAIRAKFVRKTFFEALDACASIAELETNTDKPALIKLAAKNGLKAGPNKTFVHTDPLRTARFQLIGRPPAFVFGFSGFKYSYRQLQENLELWLENRVATSTSTPMKALPAVIATQGCFAWRNAAPLALSNREMMGIGNDDSPVRLIVLQLLYMLNRRLQTSIDGYGLKPTLSAYLSHFSAPKFEVGVGNVAEVFGLKPGEAVDNQATTAEQKQPEKPAAPTTRDAAAAAQASAAKAPAANTAAARTPTGKTPVANGAAAKTAAANAPARTPAPKASAAPPAESATPSGVFDKPSPFASAPKPPAESATGAGVFDKPSPFASAPRTPAESESKPAPPPRSAAPVAPLGSAPIPGMQKSAPAASEPPLPEPEIPAPEVSKPDPAPPRAPLGSAPIPPSRETKPEVKVAPPKPPVDFDLGIGDSAGSAQSGTEPEEDEFANTVVIPPGGVEPKKPETAAASDGSSDKAAQASADDDDFSSTLVIPPDASASLRQQAGKANGGNSEQPGDGEFVNTEVIAPEANAAERNKSQKSSDEFIARVKKQLSSSEPISDDEKDFTSTIPQ